MSHAKKKMVTHNDLQSVVNRSDHIQKTFETKSPFGRLIQDVRLLIPLVRDYCCCRYKAIPFWSVAAIVTALLYVLNPLDLVPDALPGVGYVDDASIVAACLTLVRTDLHRYRSWRQDNGAVRPLNR